MPVANVSLTALHCFLNGYLPAPPIQIVDDGRTMLQCRNSTDFTHVQARDLCGRKCVVLGASRSGAIASLDAKWTALWERTVANTAASQQQAAAAVDSVAEQMRSLVEVVGPLQQRLSALESSAAQACPLLQEAPLLVDQTHPSDTHCLGLWQPCFDQKCSSTPLLTER